MEKIAIEEIVDNFKNEVEMRDLIYVTPNEKDIDGFFFEESTDEKYIQTFKENYQYALHFKNTKNVITIKYITNGTELGKDFMSEYEKVDDGKTYWKVLQFILQFNLKNSFICILEVTKRK